MYLQYTVHPHKGIANRTIKLAFAGVLMHKTSVVNCKGWRPVLKDKNCSTLTHCWLGCLRWGSLPLSEKVSQIWSLAIAQELGTYLCVILWPWICSEGTIWSRPCASNIKPNLCWKSSMATYSLIVCNTVKSMRGNHICDDMHYQSPEGCILQNSVTPWWWQTFNLCKPLFIKPRLRDK